MREARWEDGRETAWMEGREERLREEEKEEEEEEEEEEGEVWNDLSFVPKTRKDNRK